MWGEANFALLVFTGFTHVYIRKSEQLPGWWSHSVVFSISALSSFLIFHPMCLHMQLMWRKDQHKARNRSNDQQKVDLTGPRSELVKQQVSVMKVSLIRQDLKSSHCTEGRHDSRTHLHKKTLKTLNMEIQADDVTKHQMIMRVTT